jgi:hypothetical protein
MNLPRTARLTALGVLLIALTGCKSAYYGAKGLFGYEKRDILVDNVEAARDEQEEAKKQFKTTLERFQEVTNFSGGDLEAKYKKLSSEYEDSVSAAEDVSKRIKAVEEVANDMFKEWQEETRQYSSAELRRSSEQKLQDTKQRYGQLIGVMKQAEGKMKPVLAAFHDQVLTLKHSLNAQAIASLQDKAAGIESDVNKLIQDMEASIAEANSFINQMNKSGG